MKKIFPLFLLIVFTMIFLLTSGFVFLVVKKQSFFTLRTAQISLFKALEPYRKVLENARWPAQRYTVLMLNNRTVHDDEMGIIETQMLQLSLGFDYEYFLIRSFGGETRVEMKRGGLLQQKSPIEIIGEKEFVNFFGGFLVRPCMISSKPYLCLIDIPDLKGFAQLVDRNYSVIAVSITEALLKAKYADSYSQWLVPVPILEVSLDDNTFTLAGDAKQKHRILTREQKMDEGFYMRVSYPFYPLLVRSLFLSIFGSVLFFGLWFLMNHYIKKRVRFKLNFALLNKKLEHYDQVQTLIRGVVHDIKSPLAALKTLGRSEIDPDKQVLMHHVTKRLQMIARDLEIKRKTVEEHDLSILPVSVLLHIVQMEKTKEYEEQAHLIYEPSNGECWVYGAYSEFFRVMSNLINNAVEASQGTAKIQIGYKKMEGQVQIYVKDFGKGIPPEHLQHVFDQGASFGKKSGTGFGLYHCKSVIEAMKGNVFIESESNKGTTMKIQLPMVEEPSWAVSQLSLKGIEKVVVIDDEAMYHDLWRRKINGSKVETLCYSHPSQVPTHLLNRSEVLTLLDNNFGAEYGLGLRFLEKNSIANCIVVTAEWTLSDIQKAVERLSGKLCGKDYLDNLEIT